MQKPILIIGEARGAEEERIGSSFVGPSGVELLRMLDSAGIIALTSIDRDYINQYYRLGKPQAIESIWLLHPEVVRTNVFQIHPPANRLEYFCGPKAEGIPSYPALLPSKYVRAAFEPELDRLAEEILRLDPNLLICLGNTALWALLGRTGITKLRGCAMVSTHCASGYKLLPTYHPAAVLRQWELRPTTILDLMKARREAEYPDLRRPPCEIWIEPTLGDIDEFITDHISGTPLLSIDVETAGSRVTCIGLAPSREKAIVVPFDDDRRPGRSYWPDAASEKRAWLLVRSVLEDGAIPKLFQNGLYDIAFLWRAYGIRTVGAAHDTMLLSHALQPESLKGLGYLGSIWTDHGPWKTERKGITTIGRDK